MGLGRANRRGRPTNPLGAGRRSGRQCDQRPLASPGGALAAALGRVEVEIERAVGEVVEHVGDAPADEFGVQPLRGDAAVREVVVARKDLTDRGAVGVHGSLGEVAKQLRGVVGRVGASPLQLDEGEVLGRRPRDTRRRATGEVDRRARDPVFGLPVEIGVGVGQRVAQVRLNGTGERAHAPLSVGTYLWLSARRAVNGPLASRTRNR